MNAPTPIGVLTGNTRSIGEILVTTGRLQAKDLASILERQQQDGIAFGDAAVALNLLTREDIDFALSKQFDYAYVLEGQSVLSSQLVAAYQPFSRVGEDLRAVRSHLMLRWFNGKPSRKTLAVVSAGQGEGRSFIAANLAIVFAQQGQRTLLIDGDMRAKPQSSQQALFKLGKGAGLSGILAGRATLDAAQTVPGLPWLMVLPTGALPPNPQELLGRAAFAQLLFAASDTFDVILIDTPGGNDYSDGEIIAARAGAALMVARRNTSLLARTRALGRRLQEGGVALVGSVLNDT
jgi:receptor protein-tyrosine kinase